MKNFEIPPYLTGTKLHVDTCIQYVEYRYPDINEDLKKMLVNLYRKESKQLFNITKKKYLYNEEILFQNLNVNIASLKFKIKTFLKVFINNIFFYLRNRKNNFSTYIVRSWVEDCLKLYKEDINKDTIFFVYPFALKIKRQLFFIKELKERNLKYTFMGLNYNWYNLFKWLYTSNDLDYIHMEYNANLKHSKYILKNYNIKKILTTDEFEIASFILYETMSSKIKIINKAHGAGKYSPYVSYHSFYVFNDAQKEYYKKYSPFINYKLINATSKLQNYQFNGNVILFSQAVDYNDNSFISNEELKIIRVCQKIHNINFYVKPHPNSRIKCIPSINNSETILLNDIEKINNALLLSLYSTTYYDFQTNSMTYLVKTQFNNPELVFGNDARIIDISKIENLIKGF